MPIVVPTMITKAMRTDWYQLSSSLRSGPRTNLGRLNTLDNARVVVRRPMNGPLPFLVVTITEDRYETAGKREMRRVGGHGGVGAGGWGTVSGEKNRKGPIHETRQK